MTPEMAEKIFGFAGAVAVMLIGMAITLLWEGRKWKQ
jgi:hypothetical protein